MERAFSLRQHVRALEVAEMADRILVDRSYPTREAIRIPLFDRFSIN